MSPQLDETMAVYAEDELRHSDTCVVCLNGGHCLEAILAEYERRERHRAWRERQQIQRLDDGMPF